MNQEYRYPGVVFRDQPPGPFASDVHQEPAYLFEERRLPPRYPMQAPRADRVDRVQVPRECYLFGFDETAGDSSSRGNSSTTAQ